MPHETGVPVVYFEDAKLVEAALDSFIEHYREIDAGSETSDSSASAAIKRAAEARHQIEKDFRPDLAPEVRRVVALGSTVLSSMTPDELAEALRSYRTTLCDSPDKATRLDYLAKQLEA